MFEAARANGVKVRGYVSCVAGCPDEGEVAPQKVAEGWHERPAGC